MSNQRSSRAAAAAKKFPALTLAQANALLTAKGSPFEMEDRSIRGMPTRVWKNAPPTLRDLFLLSRQFGARDFVVYRDERVSYDDFARAALAIAEALQTAGLKKGDRVAIAMRNLPEWPAAFFGCLLAGGVATLLNAWWSGPELEYGLNDSGARFAFVDRERLERIAEHLHNCAALERIFVSRESKDVAHPKVTKLESILGEVNSWRLLPDRPPPGGPLDPEDDATIIYTSGTTGKPKGRSGPTAIPVRRCRSGATRSPEALSAAASRYRRWIPWRPPNPLCLRCLSFTSPDARRP